VCTSRLQEAGNKDKSASAVMLRMAQQREDHVQKVREEYLEAQRRKALQDAARDARVASAAVAYTAADLEDMRNVGSPFATARTPGGPSVSLCDQCCNMLERVKAACPAQLVQPFESVEGKIAWHGKTDTKGYLKVGGGETALGKLKELLADKTRPWYHGAQQALAARQEDREFQQQPAEGGDRA
jgi:hypothetical protein